MSALIPPTERVLSTLNADGSRRWLDPKPVSGPLRTRRHLLGWVLVVIFVALPFLHAGGKQLFFMDLANGEFTVFGLTFIRTDTLLLALLMLTIGVGVFLATALFGRVWCGWACPQTVYLEFVFRPLGTLFNGKGRKGIHALVSKLPGSVRVVSHGLLFFMICLGLANTFLAYFVGTGALLNWMTSPPWVHPMGFGFVMGVTGLMVFNFGFFREQLCIIACPYGRMQSVLLDQDSLIVGYDVARGDPRGKFKRSPKNNDIALNVLQPAQEEPAPLGDCVDCYRCVAVCPTGIDIRDGLQLECIHCTRCIDACNAVMGKLGRELGLIRYSTESVLTGGTRKMLRPRVILYPLILLILLGTMAGMIVTKSDTDLSVLRSQGTPYNVLPSGEITNQARVRVTNRGDQARTFTFDSSTPGIRIQGELPELTLEPGQTGSVRVLLVADPKVFDGSMGRATVRVRVRDGGEFEQEIIFRMLAPMNLSSEGSP